MSRVPYRKAAALHPQSTFLITCQLERRTQYASIQVMSAEEKPMSVWNPPVQVIQDQWRLSKQTTVRRAFDEPDERVMKHGDADRPATRASIFYFDKAQLWSALEPLTHSTVTVTFTDLGALGLRSKWASVIQTGKSRQMANSNCVG